MSLAALDQDAQRIVFDKLCNVLDPRVAVNLSSTSCELWEATKALRQQLRVNHEAATALCLKIGMRCCKGMREATDVDRFGLSGGDLALLGTLGSGGLALRRHVG